MRILVRYFRPMVYGNYLTLPFEDIDGESMLVIELKKRIFLKQRIEMKYQKLSIR